MWIERRWISKKILSGNTKFDICCIPACLQSRDSDDEIQMEGRKKRAAVAEMEESPYGASLDAVARGGYKEMR